MDIRGKRTNFMSILKKLHDYNDRCQFIFDSPIDILTAFFTNPFFFIRHNLCKNIKYFAGKLSGKLLDFGCGSKPYKQYFKNYTEYVGCDIEVSGHSHEEENIDVYYDGKTLPFENETFDSIFSSEVFEHIFNLEPIIQELNRVLRIDGDMLITVPFVWNEHEVPYDFGRYTSFGLTDLLERNGFKVIELRKSTSYIEVLFQMYIEYLRGGIDKIKIGIIRKLLKLLLIIPTKFLGIIISVVLPKDYSFYNDNVIYAKKVK